LEHTRMSPGKNFYLKINKILDLIFIKMNLINEAEKNTIQLTNLIIILFYQ